MRRSTPTRLPTTPYARSLGSSPRTPMTSLPPRSPSTRSPGHLHWTRTITLWLWPPATHLLHHPHGPRNLGRQSHGGAVHPSGPSLVKMWVSPPWQPPFPGETRCQQWRTADCTEVNLGVGTWVRLCAIQQPWTDQSHWLGGCGRAGVRVASTRGLNTEKLSPARIWPCFFIQQAGEASVEFCPPKLLFWLLAVFYLEPKPQTSLLMQPFTRFL